MAAGVEAPWLAPSRPATIHTCLTSSRLASDLDHLGLVKLILTHAIGEKKAALSITTLTTNYQRILKKTVTRAEGWKKPPD